MLGWTEDQLWAEVEFVEKVLQTDNDENENSTTGNFENIKKYLESNLVIYRTLGNDSQRKFNLDLVLTLDFFKKE